MRIYRQKRNILLDHLFVVNVLTMFGGITSGGMISEMPSVPNCISFVGRGGGLSVKNTLKYDWSSASTGDGPIAWSAVLQDDWSDILSERGRPVTTCCEPQKHKGKRGQ